MACAADDQLVAGRGRGVTHRPGRRIDGQEHRPGDVAGHVERHAVGPLGLQPGEEQAAVQDRDAGGQDAVPGGDRELSVAGVLGRRRVTQIDRDRSGAGHGRGPDSLDEGAAVPLELGDDAVEIRQRVELGLLAQPHTAAERERHIGFVDPVDAGQSRLPGRRQHLPGRADSVVALGVRVVVLALHADPVLVAVPQQPVAALGVAGDVGAQHAAAVLAGDVRQLAALQHADLAGGVAGGAGREPARLDDDHLLARPGEQQGGGEAGDAGADDHHVDGAGVVGDVDR